MFATIKELKKARQSLLKGEQKLFLLFGPESFLLQKAEEELKAALKKKGIHVSCIEAKSENFASFEEKFSQASLFGEENAYLYENLDQAPKFAEILKKVEKKSFLDNPLVLVQRKGTPSQTLRKELARLDGVEIQCQPPKPFEQKQYTQFLSELAGLNLDHKALESLGEAFKNNPSGLFNELKKLSLIYDRSAGKLSWETISPYVDALKEEEAFGLTTLLLEKRIPEAQGQMTRLLHSGDHALSLLGIIAYFCRTALYLKSQKTSMGVAKNSSTPKLPNFIINRYNRHMHRHSEASLKEALRKCAEADLLLKSGGRRQQHLHLSEILVAL